jgi:L-alanine-DL-glutamate epimerase-like enolase superfamily enzyme
MSSRVSESLEIERISTSLYRIPPAVPWEDATHRVSALELVVVDVVCRDGSTATGITYTVGVGGSAVKALLDDYCVDLLLGMDGSRPARVWSLLRAHLHRTGSGGINTLAIAGVDTALWDLAARQSGRSLALVLGGAQTSVPAYASSIDLFMTPAELSEHLAGVVERGYGAAKIKVGCPTIEEDLARLEAARAVLGDDRLLLLDANQSWGVDEAIGRVRAFERFRPRWIEEPLAPEDIEGHARLRQRTSVPIAVGESLYTSDQFLAYLRAGAVDVLQPDIARVGGITEWMRIAHLAAAWRRPVSAHFLAELSVQTMCAVPNGWLLEDVAGGGFAELGIVDGGPLVADGRAAPPLGSGHGIDLLLERLDPYRATPGEIGQLDTKSFKAMEEERG